MKSTTCIFLIALTLFVIKFNSADGSQDLGQTISSFVHWFKENGGSYSKIKISNIPGFGVGVKAAEFIPKGEKILTVPYSLMLIPQTAKQDALLMQIASEERLSTTNFAAVQLLYEKNNPNSFWKPYIDLLPREYTTSLFFTDEELESLQASSLKEFTIRRKQAVENHYTYVEDAVFRKYSPVFQSSSLDDWKWALSAVWSRAFNIKSSENGLVPFADSFNSLDGQTGNYLNKIDVKLTDSAMEYYTTADIPAGEQIFTPYGKTKRLSNAQLLLDYGFIVPDNKNDMVLLSNPLKESDPSYKEKIALLEKKGWNTPQLRVYRNELDDFFSTLRIIQMVKQELPKADRALNGQVISERNEKAMLRTASSLVNRALDKYETTLENDIAELKKINLSPNLRAAINVRKAEKEILNGLLKAIDKKRSEINNKYLEKEQRDNQRQ